MSDEFEELELKLHQKYQKIGEGFQLSGAELLEFVNSKVKDALDRRERDEQRNLKKEEIALKKEEERTKRAQEEEATKRAQEEEATKRAQEEEKTKRVQEEISLKKEEEMTRRVLEEQETKRQVDSRELKQSGNAYFGGWRQPRMPVFNEQSEQIDIYLFRFEETAKLMGWPIETWPHHLSMVLERNALALYQKLQVQPGELSYEILKQALLQEFSCTAEHARLRFRQCRPEQGKTAQVFCNELERNFRAWLEAKEVETFEQLTQLCLQEQLLEAVSKDLQTFIIEREPKTLQNMCEIINRFQTAHPGKSVARRVEKTGIAGVGQAYGSKPGRYEQRFGKARKRRSPPRNHPYEWPSRDTGKNRESWKNRSPKKKKIRTCYVCGEQGHLCFECAAVKDKDNLKKAIAHVATRVSESSPNPSSEDSDGSDSREPYTYCSADQDHIGKLVFDAGHVNGEPCSILRDTGANVCGVRKRLVRPDQLTEKKISCISFGGRKETFQLAEVHVESEYYSGTLLCCVLEDPVADLIIGNVPGLSKSGEEKAEKIRVAAQVTTRARSRHNVKKTTLEESAKVLDVSPEELIILQKQDESLSNCFKLAETGEKKTTGAFTTQYYVQNGILKREFASSNNSWQQIVVPTKLRAFVLASAHDTALAGHCGARRTLLRLRERFFWPGVTVDTAKYVSSCDPCQKAAPKGRTPPVPLSQVPVISTPFERVAIDIVGPFTPASEKGHRYILTIVDIATRYPEAAPLKEVTSEVVAEALFHTFSRLGFPTEILSDRGPQFNSELTRQFFQLCGCKGILTSPYHPQANGNVERFHGTLKPMLRKVVQDKPRRWHEFLPALLFACRELPCESTGFSPFRLLFGREVRGPIALIADTWCNKQEEDEKQDIYQYVFKLQNRIKHTCEIAAQNSQAQSARNKLAFDKRARQRTFKQGDEVLLLLPSSANKLLSQWKGPYTVKGVNHPDYTIVVNGRDKLFHANMLKRYHRREHSATASVCSHAECEGLPRPEVTTSVGSHVSWSDVGPEIVEPPSPRRQSADQRDMDTTRRDMRLQDATACAAGVVIEDDDTANLPTLDISGNQQSEEDYTYVKYGPELSDQQREKAESIIAKNRAALSTKPGCYKGEAQLSIDLSSTVPVRRRMYDLPYTSKQIVEKEINAMLELGVIEKSRSAYAAPVVLVQKKDGDVRFCVDYRNLNKVTVFDAEPIPNMDSLFVELGSSRYFTKIDLAKGYWQIPVKPQDRHKTAFATHLGLFQFTRMPFGLLSAPAVFERMMRELHLEESEAVNFFDDILVHGTQFDHHLKHVDEVLQKISNAGLTAKPSKVEIGFHKLEFLGHVVGEGMIRPEENKVKKIMEIPTPKTKKQVRSLLGLTGFYRRYIPDYATLSAPLTDLTKGHLPSRKPLEWSPKCQQALDKMKQALSSKPVLRLPDMEKQFTLRTDASSSGLGAVLLQEWGGDLFPVIYASRKLLDRERRYSTIERECLGIVWATGKLVRYLHGRRFILQTDHKPLTFLKSASFRNSRVMRWALALQEFAFDVEPIKGELNTIADLLSRADTDQLLP